MSRLYMIRLLFIVILFISCTAQKKFQDAPHTVNTDYGTIIFALPTGWTLIKKQGIDSYVGSILTSTNDTLHYDLGYYSFSLEEQVPDDFEGDDYSPYEKSRSEPIILSGYTAKLVLPKKTGSGITGLYIDSLWKNGTDIVRFSLYGFNLHKKTEKGFLRTIAALKIIK